MNSMESLRARLIAKAVMRDSGCREWQGAINDWGYGRIAHQGKAISTHRASYLAFVGPIPNGMCVCHSCDNRICINPNHFWLGTQKENMRDASSKGRLKGRRHARVDWTHCINGHPFFGENLRIQKTKTGRGYRRICLACHHARAAKHLARQSSKSAGVAA